MVSILVSIGAYLCGMFIAWNAVEANKKCLVDDKLDAKEARVILFWPVALIYYIAKYILLLVLLQFGIDIQKEKR